jgi:hypothetical protein
MLRGRMSGEMYPLEMSVEVVLAVAKLLCARYRRQWGISRR